MNVRATPPPLDEERRRLGRRILMAGVLLAVAGSLVSGLLGASGATSLGMLLLGVGVAFGVTGMVGMVTALVDELRGHRVAGRRLLIALAQLLAVPVWVVLANSAAGAA